MEKLFDDTTRKSLRSRYYDEPAYKYLNCSAKPECERVRDLLEQWFNRLPAEVQPDLRSRFRKKDDRQHLGAFFELYLHELLLQLEFEIKFHPQIQGETTHPDFLVKKSGNPIFYLEATLAARSDEEAAMAARKDQVYDTINRMKSPNFFICLEVTGAPNTPPRGRNLRNFLERQLADLDPDEIEKQYKHGGFQALPSWKWEHDGWEITFYPLPKIPEARGKPGVRPIGLMSDQRKTLSLITPHIGIRDSIENKASKYGKLDLPLIVAINVIDELTVDNDDIGNALFGEETYKGVLTSDGTFKLNAGRNPNGAWYGPSGPQNKRVSAVLITDNLDTRSIEGSTPVLYHNPWANHKIPKEIFSIPQLVPDNETNQLVKIEGKSIFSL